MSGPIDEVAPSASLNELYFGGDPLNMIGVTDNTTISEAAAAAATPPPPPPSDSGSTPSEPQQLHRASELGRAPVLDGNTKLPTWDSSLHPEDLRRPEVPAVAPGQQHTVFPGATGTPPESSPQQLQSFQLQNGPLLNNGRFELPPTAPASVSPMVVHPMIHTQLHATAPQMPSASVLEKAATPPGPTFAQQMEAMSKTILNMGHALSNLVHATKGDREG